VTHFTAQYTLSYSTLDDLAYQCAGLQDRATASQMRPMFLIWDKAAGNCLTSISDVGNPKMSCTAGNFAVYGLDQGEVRGQLG
jgi:hypothetical protein